MTTYNVFYIVGSLGTINIDVECDTNRNDPSFMNDLREAANKLVEAEVTNYGDIDFVYG